MNSQAESKAGDSDVGGGLELPPLSLYVHLPWCVRKCPYCDFNSHEVKGDFPGDEYVTALLADLEQELPLVWGRPVNSIFFGGGTPSLFSADQIERLLAGFRSLLVISPEAEITLEANPGTTEHDTFKSYREAGVNRVSLGVQSFRDDLLTRVGRIHGREEVERAIASIHASGMENFNLDLMFALPGQSMEAAIEDVQTAIAHAPSHVSHYQLTIEPNTQFHVSPPELPDENLAWDMQEQCGLSLSSAGYRQYEISAWARPGSECRHNLNYWQYGDFLGIGAGAHGKVTIPSEQSVRRRVRKRHPKFWMQAAVSADSLAEDRYLDSEERIFEFFLNQLRLLGGVRKSQFRPRTGLAWEQVSGRVRDAVEKGLLREENELLVPTELGIRFGNETQAIFLP